MTKIPSDDILEGLYKLRIREYDVSGSYSVFTEQGSSASLMTAAKDHGYHFQIAWLRCTSSRRSIGVYPSENGRCSQIVENSKIGVSRHFGFVYHDTNGQNHGAVWKTQSFFLSGICTVIFWQDYNGKEIWENPFTTRLGEGFQLGMVIRTLKKEFYYLSIWMTLNWLARNETLIRCGKYLTKKSIWEIHLSKSMYSWDAFKDNVK